LSLNNVQTMVIFFRHIKSVLFFSAMLLILTGCDKEDQHPVPMVPVDFRINLEFQYIELNSIGGHINVFGGFGGIVIYRMSVDQFTAFDRACPHHPYEEGARIVVEDPPLAKCNVCESVFLLLDGVPVSGPSRFPLRSYRTVYDGRDLYVTNY
jgi:nitrite reductase/ring-hydroxylating ferredoxin subunit